MKSISSTFRSTITLTSLKFKCFCALSSPNSTITEELTLIPTRKKSVPSSTKNPRERGGVRARVSDAQLKEKWLDSLTCPCPDALLRPNCGVSDVGRSDSDSPWVIGVDPDVSGALALLKNDDLGCSPQVFDSPHLKLLVGKRTRRRLDTKSIVQLLKSFDAPVGTTAYVEQSTPYPQDGKQGWWSGGFGYGLWIGILVASGFSVIPVPSTLWKNEFKLTGNGSSKDDSREAASTLFPSMSSLLRRKKDHVCDSWGCRAEALLIAAYGKGLKLSTNSSRTSEELTSTLTQETDKGAETHYRIN
ncbi:hypothetical protein C3L33_05965, partial [Rhododendron williamsianum]